MSIKFKWMNIPCVAEVVVNGRYIPGTDEDPPEEPEWWVSELWIGGVDCTNLIVSAKESDWQYKVCEEIEAIIGELI